MWSKFWGFWILGILDFGSGDFGSWGFWILDFGDFGFWGFWILDCGDFGSWILDRYVANLYVRPPTPQIWGFGILDFGGFGDFGFWILRLGGWKSLGAKLEANFGFYIRVRRLCTPPRVGGLCLALHLFLFWFLQCQALKVYMKSFGEVEGCPLDT